MTDPRRARTRLRLIEAAHRLIAEDGVAALRIAEITREAGVAMGSFQNHFDSKDALVEAVAREAIEKLAGEIVATPPADADAAVVAMAALRRFVRLAYEDPAFCRLVVNLGHGDVLFLEAIRPYARQALARAVEEGHFVIDDVEIATTATVAGALAVIRSILDGDIGPCADTVLARMALLSYGVEAEVAVEMSRLPLSPSKLTPTSTGERQTP